MFLKAVIYMGGRFRPASLNFVRGAAAPRFILRLQAEVSKRFYSPKAKSSNISDFFAAKYTVLNLVKLGMRKDAYSTVDRLYAH